MTTNRLVLHSKLGLRRARLIIVRLTENSIIKLITVEYITLHYSSVHYSRVHYIFKLHWIGLREPDNMTSCSESWRTSRLVRFISSPALDLNSFTALHFREYRVWECDITISSEGW